MTPDEIKYVSENFLGDANAEIGRLCREAQKEQLSIYELCGLSQSFNNMAIMGCHFLAYKESKKQNNIDIVINAIKGERARQDKIYGPIENSKNPKDQSLLCYIGVIAEEFGELSQAITETWLGDGDRKDADKGGFDNMFKEASHLAASVAKFMEFLLFNKDNNEYKG